MAGRALSRMFKTAMARFATLRCMKVGRFASPLVFCVALTAVEALAQDGDIGYDSNVRWSSCKVDQVATYATRVHVRCGGTGFFFRYFASPTSNAAEAARLVTLGTAAMTGAGTLWILADMRKQDAASYGCAVHDCRRPMDMQFNK